MNLYVVEDVFTPSTVPSVTYVRRSDPDVERQLVNALKTPGLIISLSGPTKSGKTALVRHLVPEKHLITIGGGSIVSADRLWERVLNAIGSPSSTTKRSSRTKGGGLSGSVKIPAFFASFLGVSASRTVSEGRDVTTTQNREGIDQVIHEIGNTQYVVFLDDFHGMDTNVQPQVCKQLKEAAEKGVKICTASVPYRSHDVVRANSDLRGRIQGIDFGYWRNSEIQEIGRVGFAALGVSIAEDKIVNLAQEAFGSPQLMQAICLNVCREIRIKETISPSVTLELDERIHKLAEVVPLSETAG